LLFAWLFAKRPIGPVRWPWFIVLSLGTTLACAIPMYVWLNWRRSPAPRKDVIEWWRTLA